VDGQTLLTSNTFLNTRVHVESNISTGTDFLIGTSLTAHANVYASTLSLVGVGVLNQTGDIIAGASYSTPNSVTVVGSLSTQSNVTVQGGLTTGLLNGRRAQANQFNTTGDLQIGGTSLYTNPTYILGSGDLAFPSIDTSGVAAISTVCTQNLYLNAFTADSASLTSILFSDAAIQNSDGHLQISSIQGLEAFSTPIIPIRHGITSTLYTSSIEFSSLLSTISPSQNTLSFTAISSVILSTLQVRAGSLVPRGLITNRTAI
jgi:hypothetical protein